MSDLVHLSEMAEYLGISEWAVTREIKAKRLPARKTGKGWTTLWTILEEFRVDFYSKLYEEDK